MARIDTVAILAAGRGSRLNTRGVPKPLVPFLGIPLLERSIRGFYLCGLKNFIIVTGFESEKVEAFAKELEKKIKDITIHCIKNTDWQRGNGTSFLTALRVAKKDFILSMCDHVFSEDVIKVAKKSKPPKGGLSLIVDTRLKNPVIDPHDVTKVLVRAGNIIEIGKELSAFNCYDTGLFVCSKSVQDSIKHSKLLNKESISLSEIVYFLSRQDRARAVEINKGFWADLDDKRAFQKAKKRLFVLLRSKPHDGPVSRFLNRPLSIRLSSYLVNTPVTPNQITLISFFLAILAALFFTQDSYVLFATGGLLAQLASIIDGCDGEIARLKFQQSEYGAWLDAVLDRYADAFLIAGITWHVANYRLLGNIGWLLGIFALIGSFINSYTADKYDGWMRKQKQNVRIRLGRDVRIFLVFLSGVFYRPVELLIMLAGIMHTENIRRMWKLRTAVS